MFFLFVFYGSLHCSVPTLWYTIRIIKIQKLSINFLLKCSLTCLPAVSSSGVETKSVTDWHRIRTAVSLRSCDLSRDLVSVTESSGSVRVCAAWLRGRELWRVPSTSGRSLDRTGLSVGEVKVHSDVSVNNWAERKCLSHQYPSNSDRQSPAQ